MASYSYTYICKHTVIDHNRITCGAVMIGPLIIKSIVVRVCRVNVNRLFMTLIIINLKVRKGTIFNCDIFDDLVR